MKASVTPISKKTVNLPISIALSMLSRSPLNMRTLSPSSNQADHELLASIRAKGLIQNLVVYKKGDGYEVPAGGRRLAALEIMRKEGEIAADYPVACLVIDASESVDVSLLENINRLSPHYADIYTGFVALLNEGQDTKTIAKTHGITLSQVDKYLRLGRVHKKLFTLFEKNQISLDQIMAFAATPDTKLQLATFKSLGEDCDVQVVRIREALEDSRRSEDSALVKFVTLKAYIDAGGQIENDLFKEKTMITDIALLVGLAEAKLAEEAKKYSAWKWCEFGIDINVVQYGFNRLPHKTIDTPPELQKKKDAIDEELQKLDDMPEDDWNDELQDIYYAVDEQRDALLEEIDRVTSVYLDSDKAFAGCQLTIDSKSGELLIIEGVMTSDDVKAFRDKDQPLKSDDETAIDTAPAVAAKQGISSSLSMDLGLYRRSIVQAELAINTKLSVDLLHFQLCKRFFHNHMSYFDSDLDVSISKRSNESSIGDYSDTQAAQTLEGLYTKLDVSWLTYKSDAKQFDAFRALTAIKKNNILAYCSACSLTSGTSTGSKASLIGAICSELDIQYHQYWRPSKSNYFSRLTKGLLLPLGKKLLGAAWAKNNANSSKKAIVDSLDAFFTGDDSTLTEKQLESRESWMPKEIR